MAGTTPPGEGSRRQREMLPLLISVTTKPPNFRKNEPEPKEQKNDDRHGCNDALMRPQVMDSTDVS